MYQSAPRYPAAGETAMWPLKTWPSAIRSLHCSHLWVITYIEYRLKCGPAPGGKDRGEDGEYRLSGWPLRVYICEGSFRGNIICFKYPYCATCDSGFSCHQEFCFYIMFLNTSFAVSCKVPVWKGLWAPNKIQFGSILIERLSCSTADKPDT